MQLQTLLGAQQAAGDEQVAQGLFRSGRPVAPHGQELFLVYEDGRIESFEVTEILRYQALDPKNPYSSFQNLDNQNEILTVGQMFDRAYQGDRHLTLQTCIAANGISSWGRLFVIASPKSDYLSSPSYALER